MDPIFPETIETKIMVEKNIIGGEPSDNLDENQKQLDDAKEEKNTLRLQEQRVRQANPYQEVMNEQDRKMKELQERSNQLYRDSSNKQSEIDRIINEVAMKRKDMETACDKAVVSLQNSIDQLSAEIGKLDDMLRRQKGSLVDSKIHRTRFMGSR